MTERRDCDKEMEQAGKAAGQLGEAAFGERGGGEVAGAVLLPLSATIGAVVGIRKASNELATNNPTSFSDSLRGIEKVSKAALETAAIGIYTVPIVTGEIGKQISKLSAQFGALVRCELTNPAPTKSSAPAPEPEPLKPLPVPHDINQASLKKDGPARG